MKPKPPADIPSLVASLAADFPVLDKIQLSRYLGDIVDWNDRAGLVSKRTTTISLDRLVRQSVQLLEFITRYAVLPQQATPPSVVDIGSGAGFPGIVWKLVEPTLRVTLVERKPKKATFLERMVSVLGMDGVEVVEGDAVEVAHFDRFRGHFDAATSIAVGAPAAVAHFVEGFLCEGGCYCTMRPRREKRPAETAGKTLVLVATEEQQYGRFSLFRKSAG